MTFPDVLELPIAHTTYNIMITFLVILFCLFFCVSFINPKGTSIRKNAAKLIVRKIYVYPIKSCLGISLSSAEVTKLGLKLDRSWCILNRNHKFISQRDEPALGFIKLRVEADMLVVSAPGMQQDLRLPIASTEAEPTDKERIIDTSVWGNDFRCQLLDEKYSMWFREYLNLPAEDPNSDCVLAALLPPAEHDRVLGSYDTSDHKISTGFADGYPLLLTTTESLADLNAHLAAKNAAPMKAYKFRPNIIVSAATEDDERRQAKKAGAGVSADTDAGVNVNADAGADAGNYVDASIIRARNMVEEEARKTAQAFPPLTAWAEHTWKEVIFTHPDPVQQNQKYADTGDANGQDDRNNKGESAENSTREMNGNTGTVKFDVAKKCGRCMMTTLDEEQKRRKDGEPLKTLRTLSANHTGEAVFGENIIQHTDSVGQSISVGDVVYVSKYRTAEEIAAQSPKSKYAAHFDSVYEPLLSLAVTITGSCLIYCCLQEAGRL